MQFLKKIHFPKMLRKLSLHLLTTTSEICRVSPALAKLLTCDTNYRTYRGRGLTYDDDEDSYDDSATQDSNFRSNYRSKQNFEPRTHYAERNSYRNNDFYDDSATQDSNFRSNYRSKQNFEPRTHYAERNSYRNKDFYDDEHPFQRPNYERKPNLLFGQNLVKPKFDTNDLPPVEKYFYIEHDDVAKRSLEEVESYREKFNMSVRGSDVPKPITSFQELCLPDHVQKVIEKQEYSEPTPIQAQGWPIALSGRDMVGISQTGSGKTLVFMLPAIIHALNQPKQTMGPFESRPQVLVLAPTRELVQQILEVSYKFSKSSGLISSSAYGGASRNFQLRNLKGAHICVATPGRLIDFVSEGLVDLQQCSYLVLDEADRMLDMGFEPQIRKIVDQIRPDRQTLMWSATWPQEIQSLAEDFLTNYIQVTVGAGELVANPKIKQNIYIVEEREKEERILALLQQLTSDSGSKVLVFAQTKRKVDYLSRHLNSLGIPVMCIHGDVSQSGRDRVLSTFRKQKTSVLIATDVAARGLDISDVQCVVNYDFPLNIEDYIHRIGRTARGDLSGEAHSFFTHENAGIAKDLITVLLQANQDVLPELYDMVKMNKNKSRGNPFLPRRYDPRRRQFAFR